MTPPKRIRRIIPAWVRGTVLILGFAAAGLLGIALVVIPGALGILAMEFERANRWLRGTKAFPLGMRSVLKKDPA